MEVRIETNLAKSTTTSQRTITPLKSPPFISELIAISTNLKPARPWHGQKQAKVLVNSHGTKTVERLNLGKTS